MAEGTGVLMLGWNGGDEVWEMPWRGSRGAGGGGMVCGPEVFHLPWRQQFPSHGRWRAAPREHAALARTTRLNQYSGTADPRTSDEAGDDEGPDGGVQRRGDRDPDHHHGAGAEGAG